MALPTQTPIPNVKYVVAVASGKGGVGKSTMSVNIATALSVQGLSVGLLDADIYGPSQPRMTGLAHGGSQPQSDGKRITPVTNHGLKIMSMGFMMDEGEPLVWRGPMAAGALKQMLFDVNWGTKEKPLDVLVVDMPPGTGDIQLSMSQQTPITGAVIVSTPQDIALLDAKKGLEMFRKVNVPIIGMIENMSSFFCPNCSHVSEIFGSGGVEKSATEMALPLLGKIPLSLDVRENTDVGKPLVISKPDSPAAEQFRAIATQIADYLKEVEENTCDGNCDCDCNKPKKVVIK